MRREKRVRSFRATHNLAAAVAAADRPARTPALARRRQRLNFTRNMKPLYCIFAGLVVLLSAGCAPKQPPAPVVPEKSKAELQRTEFFGTEVATDSTVVWRPNGLGVKILAAGDGLAPQPGDRVAIAYSGRLKDGTVFNETAPGKPLEAKLGEMIPGMTAGVAVLKPGGRVILYIPPSLGYGSMRVGKIPPVSGLIFEIELVSVTAVTP